MRRVALGLALLSAPAFAHPGHEEPQIKPQGTPKVHRDRPSDECLGLRPDPKLCVGIDKEKRPIVRLRIELPRR